MRDAQIHITADRGAIDIHLRPGAARPEASLRLGTGMSAASLTPLRWAGAAALGGWLDPAAWLEGSTLAVRIDEVGARLPGHRRFEVGVRAEGGPAPLSLSGSAELPSWVVTAARWVASGALSAQGDGGLEALAA